MGFDLRIAAKRDPGAGAVPTTNDEASRLHCTVSLNGRFDEAAAQAVFATVSDLAAASTDPILVSVEDVTADPSTCLNTFADDLMRLRAQGAQVQVAVRDQALHARMAALPRSRDWLLRLADIDPTLPRRAVHLDGS